VKREVNLDTQAEFDRIMREAPLPIVHALEALIANLYRLFFPRHRKATIGRSTLRVLEVGISVAAVATERLRGRARRAA
jgi:hypothetical protein